MRPLLGACKVFGSRCVPSRPRRGSAGRLRGLKNVFFCCICTHMFWCSVARCPMTAAALLLLWPFAAATINVTSDADPACPCMDVRAIFRDAKLTATGDLAELLSSEGSPCNESDVLDYQSARSSRSSVTAFCYEPNYGSSQCNAWDARARAKAHACGASAPPAWCSQRWCCASCTWCGTSGAASEASERRRGAATALGKPEGPTSGRPAMRSLGSSKPG